MKKNTKKLEDIFFVAPHYAQCIDKYELDITDSCDVRCRYCSLKNKGNDRLGNNILSWNVPADIKQKGIYLSPNSDPFSKRARNTTHEVLARFLPQGVPFLIITKNEIPRRTIDLLAQYSSQVYVQVSISRLDDALNAYIEPGAASAADRLNTIRKLIAAGIRVTPILMPLYPMLDDTVDRLPALVRACADAGARYLKAAYVVINTNDPKQMLEILKRPLIQYSFLYLTEYLKIHIGGGMTVAASQRMIMYQHISELCRQYGIQFQSCPILDPAVLEGNTVCICASYRKKNVQQK
ncbi:MAG: radical SAM protein [bacterium]